MAQLLIAIYLAINQFLEMIREIIQFQTPLKCFAKSLVFLGMSAVATLIGDMNMLWICIFLSFFVPSMLMKKDDGKTEEQKAADS